MFKRKPKLKKDIEKWNLIKIQINQYLKKSFKKNPLLNPEDYCYWKKNSLFFHVSNLESYNFYKDEDNNQKITINNKPIFIHQKSLLIINYDYHQIFLKTKHYNVPLEIAKIDFLKKDENIINHEFSSYKHTNLLTNIFVCNDYFFKFLSIEPIKLAIILNIIANINKAKFLHFYKIKGVLNRWT